MNAVERAPLTAATHEAAHWAVCDRINVPVEHIEIGVRRPRSGDPQPTGYVKDANVPVDREAYILMCLAGPEAQARVEHDLYGGSLARARHNSYAVNDDRGEGSDVADARRLCRESGFSLRRAQVDVISLVDVLWPRVQRAAVLLLDRRVLRVLNRLPEDQRDAVEDAGWDEAERVIAKRATQIDGDAAVLIERGRL